MDQQDRVDRAVESLHQAAVDHALWSETSALIDRACGWQGSHLVIVDRHTRGRPEWLFDQFYYHGESYEEMAQEYVRDFYPHDERIPRFMAASRPMSGARLVVHVNPLPARSLDFGARSAVVLVDPGYSGPGAEYVPMGIVDQIEERELLNSGGYACIRTDALGQLGD